MKMDDSHGRCSLPISSRFGRLFCFAIFSVLLFLYICVIKREQILWFLTVSTGVSAVPVVIKQEFLPLRFSGNGTFQIAVFEDLHYGEGEI